MALSLTPGYGTPSGIFSFGLSVQEIRDMRIENETPPRASPIGAEYLHRTQQFVNNQTLCYGKAASFIPSCPVTFKHPVERFTVSDTTLARKRLEFAKVLFWSEHFNANVEPYVIEDIVGMLRSSTSMFYNSVLHSPIKPMEIQHQEAYGIETLRRKHKCMGMMLSSRYATHGMSPESAEMLHGQTRRIMDGMGKARTSILNSRRAGGGGFPSLPSHYISQIRAAATPKGAEEFVRHANLSEHPHYHFMMRDVGAGLVEAEAMLQYLAASKDPLMEANPYFQHRKMQILINLMNEMENGDEFLDYVEGFMIEMPRVPKLYGAEEEAFEGRLQSRTPAEQYKCAREPFTASAKHQCYEDMQYGVSEEGGGDRGKEAIRPTSWIDRSAFQACYVPSLEEFHDGGVVPQGIGKAVPGHEWGAHISAEPSHYVIATHMYRRLQASFRANPSGAPHAKNLHFMNGRLTHSPCDNLPFADTATCEAHSEGEVALLNAACDYGGIASSEVHLARQCYSVTGYIRARSRVTFLKDGETEKTTPWIMLPALIRALRDDAGFASIDPFAHPVNLYHAYIRATTLETLGKAKVSIMGPMRAQWSAADMGVPLGSNDPRWSREDYRKCEEAVRAETRAMDEGEPHIGGYIITISFAANPGRGNSDGNHYLADAVNRGYLSLRRGEGTGLAPRRLKPLMVIGSPLARFCSYKWTDDLEKQCTDFGNQRSNGDEPHVGLSYVDFEGLFIRGAE